MRKTWVTRQANNNHRAAAGFSEGYCVTRAPEIKMIYKKRNVEGMDSKRNA